MSGRRAAAFAALVGIVACAPILGIEELRVERSDEPLEVPPPSGDAAEEPPEMWTDDGGWAADVQGPPEVDAGPIVKRVFVTSDTSNGNMGGFDKANERCVAAAERAGLGGTWIAWLSNGQANAIDRIEHNGPYERLDGTLVVKDKVQLATSLLSAPIDIMENGQKATNDLRAWTATYSNGSFYVDCDGWSTSSGIARGAIGLPDRQDSDWTNSRAPNISGNWGCNTNARLYCFEL